MKKRLILPLVLVGSMALSPVAQADTAPKRTNLVKEFIGIGKTVAEFFANVLGEEKMVKTVKEVEELIKELVKESDQTIPNVEKIAELTIAINTKGEEITNQVEELIKKVLVGPAEAGLRFVFPRKRVAPKKRAKKGLPPLYVYKVPEMIFDQIAKIIKFHQNTTNTLLNLLSSPAIRDILKRREDTGAEVID